MIFSYFKQFFYYFDDYKKAFIKYSILSVVAGFLELFGVALTYPFVLKLLSKTESGTLQKSTLIFGGVILLLFILKNVFMILFTYIQAKFTNKFEIAIKKRFMNFFLASEYQEVSKISLAKKNKIFGLLIPNIMNNFILRLLNLNINLLIFIFITICIAIKFPIATIIALLCAFLIIKVQNNIYKPMLTKISQKASATNLLNNQGFNEAVLNIKSIKIAHKEKYFYDNFSKYLKLYYENNKKMCFLTTIPPFVVEPFAILLLFVLLMVISYQNINSPEKLVASFALIAAAIFRLTPAISRIQVNLNGINSALPMVKEFIDLYDMYKIKYIPESKEPLFTEFKDSIELKNVYFEYENNKPILQNINLKINKGEFIGIAGPSGAGKTTLVDVISGLYKPLSGDLLIDGQITSNRLKVGYIPQEFSLIAGTVRENVAFGNSDINDKKVIEALKKAQLYDFIEQNYPKGIYENPFTDSTGLSVGQKQRMAIARALYSEPDVLILDEATSSLDLKTEDEICHVLNELKTKTTIIVIAHRLSTIKSADRILFMENGMISAQGSFDELIQYSDNFKELVKLAFDK